MKSYEQFIQLLNSHRRTNGTSFSTPRSMMKLSSELEPWTASKVVSTFRQDLMAAAKKSQNGAPSSMNQHATQEAICAPESGLILGKFASRYNSQLSVEALAIEHVAVPTFVPASFASSAAPIRVLMNTTGFNSNRIVAVFMEELEGIDHTRIVNDRAFYMVDRFALRSLTRTLPIVSGVADGEIKNLYSSLSFARAEQLSAAWVTLHEYFHRMGAMPIPQCLSVKNTRSAAAIEELRVDLSAVLACLDGNIAGSDGHDLANFVFAERLLRYGTELHPHSDYDGRSSHILWGMFAAEGIEQSDIFSKPFGITQFGGAVRSVVKQIEDFESSVASMPVEQARVEYVRFARKYLRVDQGTQQFQPWPIFNRLRPTGLDEAIA